MKKYIITAASLLAVNNANAITLKEGLFIVYNENPSLQEFKKDVNIAEEKTTQAFSGFLPQIDASYAINNTEYDPQHSNNYSTQGNVGSVSATQNIFQGGAIIAGYSKAKTGQKVSDENLINAEQNTFLDASDKYLSVLTSKKVLELSKRRVATNAEELKRLTQRFNLGDITLPAMKEFEARYAGYIATKEASYGQVVTTKSEFKSVFNREPNDLIWPNLNAKLPKTIEDSIKFAKTNNPTIKVARLNLKTKENDITIARAKLIPSVVAQASWNSNHNLDTEDYDNSTIGIKASMDLFTGGNNYSKLSAAKIELKKAEDTLTQSLRDLEANTKIAFNNVLVEKARVESLTVSLNSYKITTDAIRKQEEAGEASIIDVLDAEDDEFSADVDLQIARKNLILAQLKLLAQIGKFSYNDLNSVFEPKTAAKEIKGASK